MVKAGWKIAIKCIFVIFLSSNSFGESVELLKHFNVRQVMNQLFIYHVDKNEINKELIERSFSIYLKQFDQGKFYLLQSEVEEYLTPSSALLERAISEYKNDKFSSYYDLNRVVQGSILRAQKIRKEIILNDREVIFESVSDGSINLDFKEDQEYASDEDELRERIRAQLIRFIVVQKLKIKEFTSELEGKILKLYERRLVDEENEYLFIGNEGELFNRVERENFIVLHTIKAFAESLDSHTAYFSPTEAFDMKVRLEKGFFGLGIVLQESIEGVVIIKIIKDGPADKSGEIQENDRIVKIDDYFIENHSFRKVLNLIRGQEGSSITLGLNRSVDGEEKYYTVVLERGKVHLNEERVDISYESFSDGIIGTIRLYSFYEGADGISSEKDVRRAINTLKKKGKLKGLILDLRENTGGFLQQAVRVAGLFITNGVVVISKYSGGQKQYYRDVDGYAYYSGPLVVLTSKISASAAEIVAQSLQDYGVGLVVGDPRTYGKGSIQHQTVTDGIASSFFKVTVGKYYTVSGRSTQLRGVKADLIVPGPYNTLPIGEEYLEHPLKREEINSAFKDSLTDIDPIVRHWFKKYYTPTLQEKKKVWREMLPTLQDNSQERIIENKGYQAFLAEASINGEGLSVLLERMEVEKEGEESDFQLTEAIKIIKDMVFLRKNESSK